MHNGVIDNARASRTRVLVADDKGDILTSLQIMLKGAGYEVERAVSPQAVLDAVKNRDIDIVLMDLNYARGSTSGQEGLDLLLRVQEMDSSLPIVVMTAWSSVDLAVEAMRRGARDFVEKPWNNERLLSILHTQVVLSQALKRASQVEQANQLLNLQAQGAFIAASKAMQPVLQAVSRVGPSQANVLVTGENGTGKGLVARMLHGASSRAGKDMITVNVGGLPDGVLESEMFGHVKGAFTDAKSDRVGRFEVADGGTLFLDEVANMSPNAQARLLRAIETGEFEPVGSSRTLRADVRIISATNADLAKEIAEGRFRRDLLYRLNTIEIHIPPLRDRREDIPLLAAHFLCMHSQRYRKRILEFDGAALQVMLDYPWPGNVRELDHVTERAVLMACESAIRPSDLGLRPDDGETRQLESMSIEEIERLLIGKALRRFGGNVSQAAKALGLSRSAMYRRIEKHQL